MHVADTETSVEILYDAEKAKRVLNSNLSTPTEEFPVAMVFGDYASGTDAPGQFIEVYPDTISEDVVMNYYRLPEKPLYVTRDIGNGLIIEDAVSSVNFELPAHYLTELVGEIARMIGVRLRDDVLTQYGTAEITSK